MADRPEEITRLLNDAAGGDAAAAREVFRLVHSELMTIADLQRRKIRGGETLRSTALVNEAYLRIASTLQRDWTVRSQFYFTVSRAMRDILVEEARRRSSAKRGGKLDRADITLDAVADPSSEMDILELHRVLDRLEGEDPEGHQVVMLRYFAGLTVPEIADVMSLSTATIERRWRFLRAWLAGQLEEKP